MLGNTSGIRIERASVFFVNSNWTAKGDIILRNHEETYNIERIFNKKQCGEKLDFVFCTLADYIK